MSRSLRGLVLGSLAIAFVYLLVHVREPLRLNVGDPGGDASLLTAIHLVQSDGLSATSFAAVHDIGPLTADSYRELRDLPLPGVFYGSVGKLLGVTDIATFRLIALMVSALALWLLFSYVRRLYADRVAWIATALFGSSLLWITYADSIHQAPMLQCTGFLALWGLVRAIETRQRRHYAAAIAGSFACFLTSWDYCVFLPAAVLFTVHRKAGHPFARGHRHFVAICGLGCALAIAARYLWAVGAGGWDGLAAAAPPDGSFWTAMPLVVQRITLVFTPFAWIAVAFHAIKALRAPSLTAAFADTAAWMLVAALACFALFAHRAAAQVIAAQALLPFYAIGSALVVDRLLDRRPAGRWLALAWLAAAPLWSLYFLVAHPRAVLRRDDVAKTNRYLAAHDHNDFVLSNLMFDGPITAAFQRHRWPALDARDPGSAPREMMRLFERTGATYAHAVIFTGPSSRFVDAALWPLALGRRLSAITGASLMHRAKVHAMIAEYDGRVRADLEAVKAIKVLQLDNYALYRVDRATVMAILAKGVATARHVDFGNVSFWRHALLGWGWPTLGRDGTPASVVEQTELCPTASCKTVVTARGLRVKGETTSELGQVMLRVDPACDLRLTFGFASAAAARLSIDGFSTGLGTGNPVTFTVPRAHLRRGVNVVALENLFPPVTRLRLRVTSLDVAPACTDGQVEAAPAR